MTPAERALLIAVARLLRNMASNPMASVGTTDITRALLAVEAEGERGAAKGALSECKFCLAPLPGLCRHEDPCPLWDEYREQELEALATQLRGRS